MLNFVGRGRLGGCVELGGGLDVGKSAQHGKVSHGAAESERGSGWGAVESFGEELGEIGCGVLGGAEMLKQGEIERGGLGGDAPGAQHGEAERSRADGGREGSQSDGPFGIGNHKGGKRAEPRGSRGWCRDVGEQGGDGQAAIERGAAPCSALRHGLNALPSDGAALLSEVFGGFERWKGGIELRGGVDIGGQQFTGDEGFAHVGGELGGLLGRRARKRCNGFEKQWQSRDGRRGRNVGHRCCNQLRAAVLISGSGSLRRRRARWVA